MVAPPVQAVQRKIFIRIGRPGYRVTKIRDPETHMEGLLVQVHLPQIKEGVVPRKRFMSAFEQKKEAPNKNYQYLIVRLAFALHRQVRMNSIICPQVAAEPYETIAFRIPAREIQDETDDYAGWNWHHWDTDTKQFSFQFMFR